MTFADIVDALMAEFGIDPSLRRTFTGRLQQLQKAGALPNSGRGKRIDYTREDLRKVALVLDLLDLGLSPERAIQRAEGRAEGALSYLRLQPSIPRISMVIPQRFP